MESPSPDLSVSPKKSSLTHELRISRSSKPRRRPAIASQESPTDQAQSFFFVDSGSSTREKRAHVMRHHIQEKRRQSMLVGQSDKQNNRSPRYLPWRKKSVQEDPPLPLSPTNNGSPDNFWTSDGEWTYARGSISPLAAYNPQSIHMPALGPLTLLSASRKDPFESLPISLDQNGYELADYWASKLSYWSGKNQHIKNMIFRTAMNHPATFQAVILTYCARWRARLYGIDDDPDVALHVGQAERAISNPGAAVPPFDADSLAFALTGLSLQEERYGSKRKSEQFEDRALQLIRPRAGSSQAVIIFLLYVRYLMSPRMSTIPQEGAQWLINFLRTAEELMAKQSSRYFLSLMPQRKTIFQFESPLYTLLSSGPHPTPVPDGDRRYVIRSCDSQETWRTAAMIYIITALWDFRESTSKTARFLDHLVSIVRENSLDRFPACESFVWLLLEEGYEADMRDPERGWSTGELLEMQKLLSPDLQFKFNEVLLSFLMLNPPAEGIDDYELAILGSAS